MTLAEVEIDTMMDVTRDTIEEESKTTMLITVIEDSPIHTSQLTDQLVAREALTMAPDAWMIVSESLWPIASRT